MKSSKRNITHIEHSNCLFEGFSDFPNMKEISFISLLKIPENQTATKVWIFSDRN